MGKCAITTACVVLISGWISSAARADIITLTTSKDATIYSPPTDDTHSNGGGPGMFAGADGGGHALRSLLQFDIAGNLPAGATVTSVQLTLFLGQVAGSGASADHTPRAIELHRLTADWGEGTTGSTFTTIAGTGNGFAANSGDATWTDRFFSATSPTTWTTAGGDFAGTASASTVVSQTTSAAYTWSSTPALVSDVQSWLDNPSANDGWLLENTDEIDAQTFRAFWTREATNPALRPALQVTFTPEPREMLLLLPLVIVLTQRPRTRAAAR